jgi:DNA helicase-2/ATP-dependent DNA helicase PcrA
VSWLKVVGDPGTGKTWRLVKIAEDFGIDNTTFCTFTVSALDEFGYRHNVNPKVEMKYWNTLHGLLCRLLMEYNDFKTRFLKTKELPRGIMSVRARFCKQHGIPYNPLDPFTEDQGKHLFNQYTYYINKYYPHYLDEIDDAQIYYLIKKYEEFKEANGFIDFEDMLTFAHDYGVTLPTDNFIVDEAMDLSPLQWKIVLRLAEQAENFVVAGDELQSIFSFQGADPSLFTSIEADDVEILPQTHRVPKNIWDFSEILIKRQLRRRRARAVKGDGVLKYVGVITFDKLAKLATLFDDVFVLFRTNDLVAEFSAHLTKNGIPHRHLKAQSIWETDFIDFVRAYHKIKNGVIPNKEEAKAFLKRCKNPGKLKSLMQGVIPIFLYGHDPIHLIDEGLLTPLERVAFQTLSRSKTFREWDLKVTVVVDTIHSAKGREADTVILVDGISEKIYREIADPEKLREEERVWYVGVTRAKRNLIICRLANTIPFLTHYYGRWVKRAGS